MNGLVEAADPSRIAVVADRSLTYGDLSADLFNYRNAATSGAVVNLVPKSAEQTIAGLVALDGWAREVHLIGSELTPPADHVDLAPAAGGELGSNSPQHGIDDQNHDEETGWVLYTSGTTGQPKPVRHTMASLMRTVSHSTRSSQLRWGLLYDSTRMAGLQVVLQSLATGATLVAPPAEAALAERIRDLTSEGVTALSGTPTLWRRILQLPTDGLELQQVTLGGEIADQAILNALRSRFPAARIAHIFASTETGAAFSVTDGKAGFPIEYLTDAPHGIRLRVQDGRLLVHSPRVSLADADGFVDTGDAVEVVADRVLFRGRVSGVVNVGGSSVWPERVEDILRNHPEVSDAVVAGKENPLAGNVLVASVVLKPGADPKATKKDLRAWVRERAPGSHVPATIKVVDDLALGSTGKVQR